MIWDRGVRHLQHRRRPSSWNRWHQANNSGGAEDVPDFGYPRYAMKASRR